MSWVVDASVAAKWFFEEEWTENARALIRSGRELVAPDLILLEVANVGWKRAVRGAVPAEQVVALAGALPQVLSLLIPSGEVLGRATELALLLQHPIYDCAYLAVAELQKAPLVTADRRLLATTSRASWKGTMVHLNEIETGNG